ncbi:MAG: polymerase, sigma-24 subunit, RpoE, subfamily [Firmicutes bacterium]|nr:polymerase, sigma-24 subunit, RpoE, subfamily [Bacillota bacterium]MBP2661142.1 polymerase, sigma-24 subunit, RpoE, subfamily [Bacillota bacterium]
MAVTNENILITKAQDGDREALNTLVSCYWQPIYRLIYSKVGNEEDAKELTQDTFMNAFRSLPRYKVMDVSFKSYLGRIGINLVTDFWRKKGRTPQLVNITGYQESIIDVRENPEEYTLRLEGQEQIVNLVESLPEEQRQAVKLRVILGLSVRDVAMQMQKTEPAIKMLQQRALKNLRKMCLDIGIMHWGGGPRDVTK